MVVHAPLPPLLPLLPLLSRVARETAGQRDDPLFSSKCSTIHCSLTTVQCAHWRWIVILAVIVVDKTFSFSFHPF